MKKAIGVLLLFALVVSSHVEGTRYSLPGKPTLTRCRSPEKETFTCWWEPGSDGGLPTTYALYYRKENSDTVYECPDYQTAGENSCFFNKNSTSIWVNYNITVVATNKLGRAFSDPVDIDVVYIVKPNPPERLSVVVMEDRSTPFLRVSWEPPHKADTRSGWITLIYEIRVKLEGGNEWEMHLAGQQKMFNIFSLRSGAKYLVQVRCKPDHGFWSEWSPPSHINVPEYFHQEKSMWILIIVFSTFILLILTWLLHMNSKSLKHCILPPVPGPKIKGFDKQLLKNGMSEEVLNALMVSDFPPAASSNYEDLLVEYLEVYVPKEQEQLESKDLHNVCLKSEGSTSDSDSGRGSCDSRTLLTDRCGEAKGVKNESDWERIETEAQRQQVDWNEEVLACAQENMDSPDISNGRVKTWPSVFSPLPQDSTHPLDHQSPLIMAKQHHPSDSLFAPGSAPSYITHPDHSTSETMTPGYCTFTPPSKQPHLLHPQTQACRQPQSHSDINISSIVCKQPPVTLPPATAWSTENVEIQRVTKDNTVFLHPVKSGSVEGCPQKQRGEDYSKVKGVDRGNVLLLQSDEMEQDRNEQLGTNGAKGDCTSSTVTPAKKWCNEPAIGDGRVLATNGYVDTATFCTVPT